MLGIVMFRFWFSNFLHVQVGMRSEKYIAFLFVYLLIADELTLIRLIFSSINLSAFIMIKNTVLFLLLGLAISSVGAQSGVSFSFNGKTIKSGDLQHKILCLEQEDEFGVEYSPANPDENSKYVIGGLEFWAQVSMGQPKIIGRIAFSEPGDKPSMTFTLKDFNAQALLPSQTDAVRVNIRVAQVLRVQGKRMLGFEPLNEQKRSNSFMLIKDCQ